MPTPFWPNPAPRGPFSLAQRAPCNDGRTTTVVRVHGRDFLVPDGEPLTDILNRAYALGQLSTITIAELRSFVDDWAVDLAVNALRVLAEDIEDQ